MKKKVVNRLLMLVTVGALSFVTVTNPVLADSDIETIEVMTEDAAESSVESLPESTKEADTDESKSNEAKPEEAAPEDSNKTSIDQSMVEIAYGYQFQDGSFDYWMGGSGIYLGDGYIITSTKNTAFDNEKDERYTSVREEKRKHYRGVGVELGSYANDVENMVIYVTSSSGVSSTAAVISTNNAGYSIIKSGLTAKDAKAASIVSDNRDTDATLCGYSNSQLTNLSELVNPSDSVTVPSTTKLPMTILNRNGIISMDDEADFDAGLIGGAVVSTKEQMIVGLITGYEEGHIQAISANSFANEVLVKTGITISNSDATKAEEEKAKLSEYVDLVKDKDATQYTDESFQAFETELTKAMELLESKDKLDQKDYAKQLAMLQKANDALEDRPEPAFYESTTGIAMIALVVLLAIMLVLILIKKMKASKDRRAVAAQFSDEPVKKTKAKPKSRNLVGKVIGIDKPKKRDASVTVDQAYSSIPKGMSGEEEDGTTDLTTSEGTSVLADNGIRLDGYLTRSSTEENYPLSQIDNIIGKSRNESTIFIAGNNAISRKHALIHFENDHYVIKDLGSTNHTAFGDGRPIKDRYAALKDGDVIKIADEYFVFHFGEK